jgi:hypothetical protein
LILGLAVTLTAQGTKPAPAPDPGQQLFQQAEAALAALPEADRPMILSDILDMELPLDKAVALQGYHKLFQMALALPLPQGANSFNFYTKREAELGAIVALTDQKDFDDALELARTADVPRAKMYDFILARGVAHWPVQRGLELVHECVQADGSYPYSGAIRLAQAAKDDPITQRALLRGIYQAAANQTDVISFGLTGGFEALTQGHALAPDLDGELETALTALITRVGKDPQHVNARSTSGLLGLLQSIAPDRAAELKASYPELVVVPKRPELYDTQGENGEWKRSLTEPADWQAEEMAAKDPDGALKFAAGQQDVPTRFRALAAVALALADSKPAEARQAAAQAQALIRDDQQLNNLEMAHAAVKLGKAWSKLGDQSSARAFVIRLLDYADQRAASFDSTYRAAPEDANASGPSATKTKTFLASQLETSEPSYVIQDIYSLAGEVDFDLARRRLQSLPCDILLPLTTAQVAATYHRGK